MKSQAREPMDFHEPLRNAFSAVTPADESLHAVPETLGHEATETSYYGFNIPTAGIDCEIYFWMHPRLRMMSGGIWIWRGKKRQTLEADYFNYSAYLPWPGTDIIDYSPMPGMRIQVHGSLQKIAIEYRDDGADTHVVVFLNAILPAVGRPGGGHFTQVMKTTGSLRLRGTQHVIDGYFVRDRSWGDIRSERPRALPPATWMVGVFGDDLMFHARAFDDPAANPEWVGTPLAVAAKDRFRWGYLYDTGRLIQLTDCRMKLTVREDGVCPRSFSMELVEEGGKVHALTGEVEARLPMQMWPNMLTHYCLTRWTLHGRTGWGDAQDIQYADYVRTFANA